jgi:hypothetical protein
VVAAAKHRLATSFLKAKEVAQARQTELLAKQSAQLEEVHGETVGTEAPVSTPYPATLLSTQVLGWSLFR